VIFKSGNTQAGRGKFELIDGIFTKFGGKTENGNAYDRVRKINLRV
jgi:hypothetical protein